MTYRFAIDRGGTFTDVYAQNPDNSIRVLKLLSEDPTHYQNAPAEAIRRIISEYEGTPIQGKIPTNKIDSIRMGTTVATNALLERKGEDCAFLTTKGFKDCLVIGSQSRPDLFDITAKKIAPLYKEVLEIDERVILSVQDDDDPSVFDVKRVKTTATGELIKVIKEPDLQEVKKQLGQLLENNVMSIAIAFIHSYIFPDHERMVAEEARKMGFRQISLSSEIMPMIKLIPRAYTVVTDAYLTPCICRYIQTFRNEFSDAIPDDKVLFMKSDGGLSTVDSFIGSRAILSGPAGGVIAYSKQYEAYSDHGQPLIGFDMGGTSTDVSRFAGQMEHVFEITMAGVQIQAPQLDINTVAAGGGSCLTFQAGIFHVGPESAGAFPGPVCYNRGGEKPTITDANLVLGRLIPRHFPKIFGPNQDQLLNYELAAEKLQLLADQVNAWNGLNSAKLLTKEQVALGFIQVANETMCRPIRSLTQAKGYDASKHILMCFGGAGGQHASSIARSLGMSRVVVHKYSSILSAYGIGLADVVFDEQTPCQLVYAKDNFEKVHSMISILIESSKGKLRDKNFADENIEIEVYLNLRYELTECAIMCKAHGEESSVDCQFMRRYGDFSHTFLATYRREMGFTLENRAIIIDDVRVRASGKSPFIQKSEFSNHQQIVLEPCDRVDVYFEAGPTKVAVYKIPKGPITITNTIIGPAIIFDENTTVLVEPEDSLSFSKQGDLIIDLRKTSLKQSHEGDDCLVDPIQLSIFSNRFMSIAEQMGHVLRRSAISTNIKERLDYSCAVFGQDGGLVANAPHIPVHLGAMQRTVQYQLHQTEVSLEEGDTILSNHPSCGGTHLPDLTVITPVFHPSSKMPVFFVANRGHHADIGGLTPGSMPPFSTSLQQEGAVFRSFKLVSKGQFQEKAVTEALQEPVNFPGCSGTRNLADNLSDLKAQVAANACGIRFLQELVNEYSLEKVQSYMRNIMDNAEHAVRSFLRNFCHSRTSWEKVNGFSLPAPLTTSLSSCLSFCDYLDDGSAINLTIFLDSVKGEAVFDFTGSGCQTMSNTNAPEAIVHSAILYCLRLMVGGEIPLNQGCLKPVRIVLPEKSILCPTSDAAVVCGNVATSQRIVDCVLGAFESCAASQGCMNNITFGNEKLGYYETVAGGSGAGFGWHGESGVHTHMTNTRITDPEILERRYPVVLEKFHLREGSGGAGKWRGGDGVVRKILFRKQMTLCVLTQRRALAPYGLFGGSPAARGKNLIFRRGSNTPVSIGGFAQVNLLCGDSFQLETPGGGGFGIPVKGEEQEDVRTKSAISVIRGSVHDYSLAQHSA
ncbi:hypothetical protein Ciccas_004337 [Cichlidogyrus casuarinus]|uniref:5-oxoprolinase n=1 Tax=Cichlidogyrus casuarinus TaxID=1844966 RepID=A0ABD2QBW8_9PLAT